MYSEAIEAFEREPPRCRWPRIVTVVVVAAAAAADDDPAAVSLCVKQAIAAHKYADHRHVKRAAR